MRREFLARREAKQCNVHLVVLMQDAAQDPIFWQCEFLQQVGKKCIVHKLLLLVRLQRLMRLNYTCLLSVDRSRSGGVLGPTDCEKENTLLNCLNVVLNTTIER